MAEEYLDLTGLAARIKLSRSLIEDAIRRGKLIEGVHFSRPTGRRGKMIFWMSAVDKWIKGQDYDIRRDAMLRQATGNRQQATGAGGESA